MTHFNGRTAVLADQHPLWLEAVRPVVSELGIDVVGATTSGRDALRLVIEHEPDVLVTGISMPDGDVDGIELVRQAKEKVASVRAIVLTSFSDPKHIDAALAAGAVAYVIKTAHPEDLRAAIRQAFSHSVYLPGSRPAAAQAPRTTTEDLPDLTRRELEILRLVAEGHSNTQLAKMLWVTEQTVKFHLSNVYRKLDVSNRTEASRWAQLNGLLSSPAPDQRQAVAV
jgi:DNA-binding NarL/FixJ family response regulator